MIVIPMAGESSRFFKEGFTLPKYKLPLCGKTVFDWVVLSFKEYFSSEHFRFIVQGKFEEDNFTERHIRELGIKDYSIYKLYTTTRGQAETIFMGIAAATEQSLLIFNIDTIRLQYKNPSFFKEVDGFLEVFKEQGEQWSFVEPAAPDSIFVNRTTEKERISDLCSNGLYYFRSITDFNNCCEQAFQNNDTVKGEFYVAPLYNQIIQKGGKIAFEEVEKEMMIFCGAPDDYYYILNSLELQARLLRG